MNKDLRKTNTNATYEEVRKRRLTEAQTEAMENIADIYDTVFRKIKKNYGLTNKDMADMLDKSVCDEAHISKILNEMPNKNKRHVNLKILFALYCLFKDELIEMIHNEINA